MTSVDTRGLSERLRRFVAEAPHERSTILRFMVRIAEQMPPHSRVADVGAGDAPYAELFEHVDYVRVDWAHSVHLGARGSDIIASAEHVPVADGSFDSVLMTQVLEHVPEPWRALEEMFRILRPGGSIHVTVPLVWELHELPHDYYRYTPAGLEHLLRRAGFDSVEVTARNDCFTTVAQLLLNLRWCMGDAPDGLSEKRAAARAGLESMAETVAALAPLDARRILPLGYSVTAQRPQPS